MVTFSFLIVYTIFKSRVKTQQAKLNKKDIRFAITSVLINVSVILFSIPFFVLNMIKLQPIYTMELFYSCSFCVNFYVNWNKPFFIEWNLDPLKLKKILFKNQIV